jgi:drug/metabolite transporter (DMT)-like permease
MTDLPANGQLRKPTIADVGLIFFVGCVWGSSFLPIKIAVFETGPLLLVYLRVLAALVPLCLYMAWRGTPYPNTRFDWAVIFAMSLLNTVVPFFLLSWAGLHIDSGVMALIMGMGPLLALFVSHLTTNDDKLTVRKFTGMMIGLSGLLVIVGQDALAGVTEHLLGDLAVIGAITCYVLATALVRKVRSTAKEAMAAGNMLISAALLAPIMALTEHPPITGLSLESFLAIAYLGLVTTGIGYVLRFHLVLTVGQSFTSLASYIMPIVGVILGVLFLGEPLTIYLVVALGLVLAGFAVAR